VQTFAEIVAATVLCGVSTDSTSPGLCEVPARRSG
jgi:hypothetical protein